MSERNLPHIVVKKEPESSKYVRPSQGGPNASKAKHWVFDRYEHGRRLQEEYRDIFDGLGLEGRRGIYATFRSFPELELTLDSLEELREGDTPRVVSVKRVPSKEGLVQLVTVYIPRDRRQFFLDKLTSYLETVDDDKPKNNKLIEGINTIARATLSDLWTGRGDFPENPKESRWWEVWLRRGVYDDGKIIANLKDASNKQDVQLQDRSLGIGDRLIVQVRASTDQLTHVFDNIDDIAELRAPSIPEVRQFMSMSVIEQREWIDDLKSRLDLAGLQAPVVCILDQGVQLAHPLLEKALTDEDRYNVTNSRAAMTGAHGSEMAGLALYGDLYGALESTQRVKLKHYLESVIILPKEGGNKPDLYGHITAQGAGKPEEKNPDRNRIFMMAVTATTTDGNPTAWSATIDALSFGRAIKSTNINSIVLDRESPLVPRLFILSAGNIEDIGLESDYRDGNDQKSVEDPAQSWNAITVGAYAESNDMSNADQSFKNWLPIAPAGDISPASRTSVFFRNIWPFKPEVVAKGGNYIKSPEGKSVDFSDHFGIITTSSNNLTGFLTLTRDTSAATAQVAAIAADIWADHPEFRPETIRALVVHSAEWTQAMQKQFDAQKTKTWRKRILRRYGMGVPSLDRALHSANNAVTLIIESEISQGTDMNLHELPWPVQELANLGEAFVKMRITLSYFIEPNPASRGWNGRYKYSSHGLRFANKRVEDSIDEFQKRINKAARAEDEKPVRLDSEQGWYFGKDHHDASGSLHTDIWEGTAAELAAKGAIAVYPVGGWWKCQRKFDQRKVGLSYSLIVSIEAPEVDVDLWTPINVANKVTIEVEQ